MDLLPSVVSYPSSGGRRLKILRFFFMFLRVNFFVSRFCHLMSCVLSNILKLHFKILNSTSSISCSVQLFVSSLSLPSFFLSCWKLEGKTLPFNFLPMEQVAIIIYLDGEKNEKKKLPAKSAILSSYFLFLPFSSFSLISSFFFFFFISSTWFHTQVLGFFSRDIQIWIE